MLGGPQPRSLFICGWDSDNATEIARTPRATLRVVEAEVPRAGTA